MSEADALLAAIRQAPDDDAPRLIYADWLDEHGQPERAEFIRVQIELARQESPGLRRREAELLAEHHDLFAGPLTAPWLRIRFRRGFADTFGHTGLFVANELDAMDRGFDSSRGQARSYFRFFLNGTWWSVSSPASMDEVIQHMRSGPNDFGVTSFVSYSFDLFFPPARIHFGWLAPGNSWDAQGTLERSQLVFEIVARGKRKRIIFSHVHIPGFDSFQDSP